MPVVSPQPGVAAALPISEGNVTNLTTDLATLTTAAGAVKTATVNVSSAELLALDVTAKELLPALTGRNYYVLHNTVLHYRFVANAYAENVQNSLTIGFGSTVAAAVAAPITLPLVTSIATGALFKATVDTYVSSPATTGSQNAIGYILAATAIEQKAMSLAIDPSFVTPLTGGDSTLTVRLWYTIVNGA